MSEAINAGGGKLSAAAGEPRPYDIEVGGYRLQSAV